MFVCVRPKRSLITTAAVSFLVLTTPLFGVVYWYTAPAGAVPTILSNIALAILCLLLLIRQSRVFTSVTAEAITARGFFSSRTSIPLVKVARVVLAEVYVGHSPETSTQLVALNAEGECLYRLRGTYWHRSDLTAVAQAISRPLTIEEEALSTKEFFEQYPGSRYWFER